MVRLSDINQEKGRIFFPGSAKNFYILYSWFTKIKVSYAIMFKQKKKKKKVGFPALEREVVGAAMIPFYK